MIYRWASNPEYAPICPDTDKEREQAAHTTPLEAGAGLDIQKRKATV